MDENVIGLIAVILIFGFIPLMVFKSIRERAKARAASGDTLRRSELEELIRDRKSVV